MKPPFSYYGSKGNLSPWIASMLPDHDAYIEPFAGSAAVLMAKTPSPYEVLNDLDGNVISFWRVLREQPDDLVAVLERTPYARDEFLEARDGAPPADRVERARRFFVQTNMAFNASTSAGVGFSASHPRKANKAATFRRKIERLYAVAQRLRDVEIENTDALTVLARWNRPGTVAYLDPPYLDDTRVTNGDYAQDNGSAVFHEQLLRVLREFQGAILLSGYRSDSYDDLLQEGWSRIDKDVYAPTSSAGTASRRVECVWLNPTASIL